MIRKEPCPSCGSRDNLARYPDGHGHCFTPGCGYHEPAGGRERMNTPQPISKGLLRGEARALPRRGLTEETCRRWDYLVGEDEQGRPVQIANYRNRRGEVVAQHLRYQDKEMPWRGDVRSATLFGQHLWSGGKRLVITEGEIDAMSVSQLQEHRWPVVSIRSGASGAKRDLLANLSFLEQFQEIVLMFDMDDAGEEAARECAEALLGCPFAIKIARLPLKDANECLMAGRGEEVIRAIWNAAAYSPPEVLPLSEIVPNVFERAQLTGVPGPFPGLDRYTHGIRPNELWVIGAGSGTGKSTFCRHFMLHLHKETEAKVGGIFFEETVQRTTLALIGMHLGVNITLAKGLASREAIEEAGRELVRDKELYLFDAAFNVFDAEKLISRVRYMARTLGCQYIVLDHLSYIVEGMDTKGDDRKAIGRIIAGLRQVMRESGCTIFMVVHLRRPEGEKGFESGLEPSPNHLRGSQAIEQLADFVILLSRNKTDPETRDILKVKLSKNRLTGEDGVTACYLRYDRSSGLLVEEPDDAPADHASFPAGGPEDVPF